MIKVIEHGNHYRAPKVAECICGVCKCVFTADFKDFNYSQVFNKYLIKCPECSNIIYTRRSNFYEEWN